MINIILCNFQTTKGIKSIGPKGLLKVNAISKKPLIVQQIENIRKILGRKQYKIHVILGYQKDKVIKNLDKYNVLKKIHIVDHSMYDKFGEAKPVFDLINTLDSNSSCLIVNDGIIFTNLDIPKNNTIFTIKSEKKNFDIGAVVVENHVKYLCYDIPNIWAGVTFLHKKDIPLIKYINNNTITSKINPAFIFEYINCLIDSGVTFQTAKFRYNSIKHIKTNPKEQKI